MSSRLASPPPPVPPPARAGANMPCTDRAVHHLEDNEVLFGPGKAVNAGERQPLAAGPDGLEQCGDAALLECHAWLCQLNLPCYPPGCPLTAAAAHPAGGVAVSGLEMVQNRVGLYWSRDEVRGAGAAGHGGWG